VVMACAARLPFHVIRRCCGRGDPAPEIRDPEDPVLKRGQAVALCEPERASYGLSMRFRQPVPTRQSGDLNLRTAIVAEFTVWLPAHPHAICMCAATRKEANINTQLEFGDEINQIDRFITWVIDVIDRVPSLGSLRCRHVKERMKEGPSASVAHGHIHGMDSCRKITGWALGWNWHRGAAKSLPASVSRLPLCQPAFLQTPNRYAIFPQLILPHSRLLKLDEERIGQAPTGVFEGHDRALFSRSGQARPETATQPRFTGAQLRCGFRDRLMTRYPSAGMSDQRHAPRGALSLVRVLIGPQLGANNLLNARQSAKRLSQRWQDAFGIT